MSSVAISAFGTLVQIGDGGSPEAFTTIAELRTISGPSLTADVIDVTVHNTATPFRRFISGLIDGGEIQIDINFVPQETTHSYSTGLLADMLNRTRRNFAIVFPDSGTTTWIIPGIITSFECSSDPADVLMASVTIKVSGPPTFE
jgi:hypothetical protein